MDIIIPFLEQICDQEGYPLTPACREWVIEVLQTIELQKDDYLLKPGQICRNLYFIESGLLKCFYELREEKVCDWFFGENETIVSVVSFYEQVPGDDYIQALENSVVHYISFNQLNYAYENFREFDKLGRVLTNKYLRVWHQHARNLRRLDAEQRYLLLLRTHPELINRVPVQDLASYLNMSRETLSRMRKKYSS